MINDEYNIMENSVNKVRQSVVIKKANENVEERGFTKPEGPWISSEYFGINENTEHDPQDTEGLIQEPTDTLVITEPESTAVIDSVHEWTGDHTRKIAPPYTLSVSDNYAESKYKFKEDELLGEVLAYIDSTYKSHYSGEKYQATDLIIDAGHGVGFCIGNIIKYAKRYGKKDGYNEADLMKILHYAVILLYAHRKEHNGNKD